MLKNRIASVLLLFQHVTIWLFESEHLSIDDVQVNLVILNLYVIVNNRPLSILKFSLTVRPTEHINEMKMSLLTAYSLLQLHWLDDSHYEEVM